MRDTHKNSYVPLLSRPCISFRAKAKFLMVAYKPLLDLASIYFSAFVFSSCALLIPHSHSGTSALSLLFPQLASSPFKSLLKHYLLSSSFIGQLPITLLILAFIFLLTSNILYMVFTYLMYCLSIPDSNINSRRAFCLFHSLSTFPMHRTTFVTL